LIIYGNYQNENKKGETMKVKLKNITPLVLCSNAIRQCHNTLDKSDNGGEKDLALINRVGCKMKHESTIEMIIVHLDISGISRSLLQEWSRTRIMSQTVKSSRYTLGELKNEESFLPNTTENTNRAKQYIVFTGVQSVDYMSTLALENLRLLVQQGISNDKLKYAMPESFKTSLSCCFNFRSLRNMLSLRSGKSALWEYRLLARAIYEAIPSEYHFLLEDCMNDQDLYGEN
jgi:thymidylate synthase (FAD)